MKLKPLLEHFNSQSEIALALGVSAVAVHFWVQQDALPPKRAMQIERLTNGKLKAHDLVAPEVLHDGR